MRVLALVACLLVAPLAGCGDNLHGDGLPLAPTHDLIVVAHQDDDLLFMQPDVLEAVQAGTGVTNVYVTAGNGSKGVGKANPRYAGLMAAYGHAAHDTAWDCGWIAIAGHLAQHCRLAAEDVSLVFLAYPDGGKEGQLPNSLLQLWEGTIVRATTVADRTTTYDREELIDTVAAIVRTVQPQVVRTLDLTSAHGRDHSDHMIVGALTALAIARTDLDPELVAYRGYDMIGEPQNKIPPLFAQARGVLAYYEACATGCAPCSEPCTTIDPTHEAWLARRYAVGFRRIAHGQLRSGDQCLLGTALGACSGAPTWSMDHGRLVSDHGCLTIDPTGALAITTCTAEAAAAQRFFSDDEGRLWSGVPPERGPALDYAHLRCVIPNSDGTVTTEVCGGRDTPRWKWAPTLAITPRAQLGGFAATGRSVRLGDLTGDGLGDLCAVTGDGLMCAPGRGDGTFGAAIRIDSPTAPLAIDPESLTLGDIDGDSLPDACGRDHEGLLCARSATSFAAARYAANFGDADARATTACSITITDANGDGTADVCGLAAEGVVCTPGGASFNVQVRSAWPAATDRVLPRDLDGDHQADWCALTTAGPACGLGAERAVTTDGVPWGFALDGVVETVRDDPALTDIADIDGDGDGDLCAPVDDGTIACARSQGHGFGPRSTVAVLPTNAKPIALWLGDLDGDGHADACVDLGTTIACAEL